MAAPTDPQPATAPDPFHLDALRLSGTTDQVIGTKKVLTAVPVRKPDKAWFVRVHPDAAYTLDAMMIELKEDREMYLVAPPLWPALADEPLLKPYRLVTAINRQGSCFHWPLRLPGPNGKQDSWMASALAAAGHAGAAWVRVVANQSLGAYDVTAATGALPVPALPTERFQELLKIAFRGKLIDSAEHPALKRLRGEV